MEGLEKTTVGYDAYVRKTIVSLQKAKQLAEHVCQKLAVEFADNGDQASKQLYDYWKRRRDVAGMTLEAIQCDPSLTNPVVDSSPVHATQPVDPVDQSNVSVHIPE